MQVHELFSAIFNALETQQARDWWNGLTQEGQNEFVIIAQDQGVERAAREVEECACAEVEE